jgi:hypothetical protein
MVGSRQSIYKKKNPRLLKGSLYGQTNYNTLIKGAKDSYPINLSSSVKLACYGRKESVLRMLVAY